MLNVVFGDNVDIYFARQQVFERIQTAKESLPPFANHEMGPISTGLGEIFQYTLESETLSAMELRTIQDYIIAPQLKPLPGVNEVNSFGGFVKQYHVLVRPESLLKYDLSLRDVEEAIENNNANAAAGFIVRGWEQTYIRSIGLLNGVEDIKRIVLKTHQGAPVYIADIADILLYLGPRLRLAPRGDAGRLWAHQLQLTIADWLAEVHDTHHPIGAGLYYEEQRPEARRRAADFLAHRLPKYLDYFEGVLRRSGGRWLLGRTLSYPDLSLFEMVAGLRYAFPRAMAGRERRCSCIISLHGRVPAHPRLAAYFASPRRIPFNQMGIFRHYPELDSFRNKSKKT